MSGLAELESQITSSSASRARLLADTLELLESQGVDTSDESFNTLVSADISNEEAFRGALAASTVVIVIGTGGKQLGSAQLGRVGNVASTVVIAIASAGGRSVGGASRVGTGTVASTVVIAIASAGERGFAGSRLRPGTVASTVVIAIASAGERGFQGRMESTEAEDPATAKLPSLENLSQISDGLRQLADLVDAGQLEIGQEVGLAFQQLVEHLAKGD